MNSSIRLLFIFGLLTCSFFVFNTSASCDYGTPCTCCLPQGQYCGGQIGNAGCDATHVYECNSNCGVCDYGYRDSCATCGALSCPSKTAVI